MSFSRCILCSSPARKYPLLSGGWHANPPHSIAFISGNTLIILSYFRKQCKPFFKIICVFPFPTRFFAEYAEIFMVLYSFSAKSIFSFVRTARKCTETQQLFPILACVDFCGHFRWFQGKNSQTGFRLARIFLAETSKMPPKRCA